MRARSASSRAGIERRRLEGDAHLAWSESLVPSVASAALSNKQKAYLEQAGVGNGVMGRCPLPCIVPPGGFKLGGHNTILQGSLCESRGRLNKKVEFKARSDCARL